MGSQPPRDLRYVAGSTERQIFFRVRNYHGHAALAKLVVRTLHRDQFETVCFKALYDVSAVALHAHLNTQLVFAGKRD